MNDTPAGRWRASHGEKCKLLSAPSPGQCPPVERQPCCAGKLSAAAIQTTLRLLDFQNARNAFFLGGCEFRDLWQPQPDPWQLLQRLGEAPDAG